MQIVSQQGGLYTQIPGQVQGLGQGQGQGQSGAENVSQPLVWGTMASSPQNQQQQQLQQQYFEPQQNFQSNQFYTSQQTMNQQQQYQYQQQQQQQYHMQMQQHIQQQSQYNIGIGLNQNGIAFGAPIQSGHQHQAYEVTAARHHRGGRVLALGCAD